MNREYYTDERGIKYELINPVLVPAVGPLYRPEDLEKGRQFSPGKITVCTMRREK